VINTILIFASLAILAVIVVALYFSSKNQKARKIEEDINSFEKVLEIVKNEIVDILKTDYSLSLSDEEFERMYKRKARLNDALKNCVFGIDSAKIIVIDLIRSILVERVPPERVSWLLGLQEGMEPSNHVKFEIIMYKYKKRYGKRALAEWIEKYDLAREKPATNQDRQQDVAYYITEEELTATYRKENFELSIDEQYDVLATLVYQQYKGFGILDTLREMDINGFNCGTSGSILSVANKLAQGKFKANKSVWLYYQGKYIHLRFMDFGTEEELKRIIQLLIRYGNPGPLTAKRGYLVNTMYDKSRILALRPPASEYWAVFVRKFTLSDVSPEALIIKPYTKRGELPVQLIEFLMRGQITCAVTGRQGSGKTTLMSSIIRYIDPRYTIRVLEMAPELYLRELYPTRNILSVQETATVTAAELQDALKKSDAAVSIVGEVATDAVAARMIQMGQVASLFTIFSHHANTAKDLVLALRNSLVNSGAFNNMQVAEKQVLDVVKVDIHLDYTPDGKRYIERITEIVPLPEGVPYPEYDPNDPVNSINRITKEYYQRTTDRIGFYTHDILRYDLETHTYYTVDRFSQELEQRIKRNLGKELRVLFEYFMLKEWDLSNSNIPEGERAQKEKELKELEAYVEKYQRNVSSTPVDLISNIIESKDGRTIEEEAQEKALWAEGYKDGVELRDEFTLSLFDE
jgi:pilus assembly protein CpaF